MLNGRTTRISLHQGYNRFWPRPLAAGYVAWVISTDERVQTQSHINSNIYSTLVCCVILHVSPPSSMCIYTDGVKSAKEFLPLLIPCRRISRTPCIWKSRNVFTFMHSRIIFISIGNHPVRQLSMQIECCRSR